MSAHSLTSAVGIGSRSDDLVLDDLRILRNFYWESIYRKSK